VKLWTIFKTSQERCTGSEEMYKNTKLSYVFLLNYALFHCSLVCKMR